MPTVVYDVTVKSTQSASNAALAESGQYLAYADQTDSFGYHGDLIDTAVRLHDREWYVTLTFETVVSSTEGKAAFEQELKNLSRVEDFEEVTHPRV